MRVKLRVRARIDDARRRLRRSAGMPVVTARLGPSAPTAPDAAAGPIVDPAVLDARLVEIDWARLPGGTVRDRFDAPSGALARISLGPVDGRRIVLVPGVTGSKEDFLIMFPLLAAAGYRVEAYDMAGQYESAGAGPEHRRPPERHYSLELFVDDLLAVLADGATPAHVLGYSFAGTVTAALAVRRPELFASLTLLSAPPVPGRSLGAFKLVGPLIGHANPGLAARVMIWGLRLNVTRVVPTRQAFVRSRLSVTRRSSVADVMVLLSHVPDLRAALHATDLPMLVATGTGDLWSVGRHAGFAGSIGAEFVAYPTGHSPCETTPHQLVADLLRLFAAAERRAA
ncbi:alpha/beta fold hydrolase [Nakamurella leprariae]|uniref:Alpha/beta fold hydrolase n=1 Tax=Nakamurella leprariae TaxID=2803911 RepID=A0A939BZ96_9ACTN|nr:alpha/beta fold hydrolase [Nakamurella leprariae]MBM9467905.1 alpha/beta fold hydrolase [Nakamurella leprariae]